MNSENKKKNMNDTLSWKKAEGALWTCFRCVCVFVRFHWGCICRAARARGAKWIELKINEEIPE